jgi:hypothetical protein
LEIAEIGSVPKGLPLAAAVVVPTQAGRAGRASGVKGPKHPIPDRHPINVITKRQHRPHELVPDRKPRLDRDPPVVDVQIRPTNPTRLHPNNSIITSNNLRIRLLLDPNLLRGLKRDGAHESR